MLDQILSPILSLVSKFVTDKDKARELAHDLATMSERHAHEARIEQIKTNQESARHPNMFVAGARPFALWVCGIGFAWALFLRDWVVFIMLISGVDHTIIDMLPVINSQLLMWGMGGLLGLGGFRTYEKFKGVARENMRGTPNPLPPTKPEGQI